MEKRGLVLATVLILAAAMFSGQLIKEPTGMVPIASNRYAYSGGPLIVPIDSQNVVDNGENFGCLKLVKNEGGPIICQHRLDSKCSVNGKDGYCNLETCICEITIT